MDKKQAQELAQHMKQAMGSRDIGGLDCAGSTTQVAGARPLTWVEWFSTLAQGIFWLLVLMAATPFILAWEILKNMNFGVVFFFPTHFGGDDN